MIGCLGIRDGLLDAEEKLIWMEYADTHIHTHKIIQKYLQIIKIVIRMGILEEYVSGVCMLHAPYRSCDLKLKAGEFLWVSEDWLVHQEIALTS